MTEPKNALVKQYQKFFEFEGCELSFTDEALSEIAQEAIRRETGARAVRSVLEEIMLNVMYDLPDRGEANKWTVTDGVVRGEVGLFETTPRRRRESA
jgi:ATP-dependent Clp protease ATP-binding subunit ClpX